MKASPGNPIKTNTASPNDDDEPQALRDGSFKDIAIDNLVCAKDIAIVSLVEEDIVIEMADRISSDDIARLMEAFNRHDTDGDGLISTQELAKVMHTLGQNPTEADLQDLAYAMDTNESGTIDFPGKEHDASLRAE